jgi:hypothetical protein
MSRVHDREHDPHIGRPTRTSASRISHRIDLIDLDPRIRMLAQSARPATVRGLDAIHLGTALHSRPRLISFVTYDKRLLDAARSGRPSGRLTCLARADCTAARRCLPGGSGIHAMTRGLEAPPVIHPTCQRR